MSDLLKGDASTRKDEELECVKSILPPTSPAPSGVSEQPPVDNDFVAEGCEQFMQVDEKHIRDLMVEAAKRIPLDMQYKTSAQIDAMLKAIRPYLRSTEPVSLEKCARALHERDCGHLPQADQDAIWERDKWDNRSKAKAVLNAAGVKYE